MQVLLWARFRHSVCLIKRLRLAVVVYQYGADGLMAGASGKTVSDAKYQAIVWAGAPIGPWRPVPLTFGNGREFCKGKARALR